MNNFANLLVTKVEFEQSKQSNADAKFKRRAQEVREEFTSDMQSNLPYLDLMVQTTDHNEPCCVEAIFFTPFGKFLIYPYIREDYPYSVAYFLVCCVAGVSAQRGLGAICLSDGKGYPTEEQVVDAITRIVLKYDLKIDPQAQQN